MDVSELKRAAEALERALEAARDPAEAERIKRRRAARWARPQREEVLEAQYFRPGLAFRCGDDLLAVPVKAVRAVEPRGRVYAVPNTPRWVQGATSHRGEVALVVQLGGQIGRWVVLVETMEGPMGIAACAVEGLVELASESLEPPVGTSDVPTEAIVGVIPGGPSVVDVQELVSALRARAGGLG